jgi:hypothetical protein
VPIHDLGYRGWSGRTIPDAMRWWVIAASGARMAWRNMWLRRMLFFAWLPAVYAAGLFYFYERVALDARNVRAMEEFIPPFLSNIQPVLSAVREDPLGARHVVWSWVLMNFFRHPQLYLMVMVVGIVAPPLISRDVRSRAFLLYFSRPLTRAEYVAGKAGTVWCYLMLITTVPSLTLYLFGVLLSPGPYVVVDTWDIPFRIVAASIVLMVPTTAIALCFSSLTSESRYAAFGWFAIWVFGEVAWSIQFGITQQSWTLLSFHAMLGEAQAWVFGLATSLEDVLPSLVVLSGLTLLSLLVLLRRVSAPMRV